MKKTKYIVLISILSLILAGMMGGCAGCKKVPVLLSISPTSGPETGGTSITLTGEDFKEGATVTCGGTAGTVITFQTKRKIPGVTPPGPGGRVNVVGRNNKEEQERNPKVFTKRGGIPPTATSATPADASSPDYTNPVDTGVAIGATFSEPIQQGSVTVTCAMETLPDALTKASGDIPGVVNYDSSTTINFTPSIRLKAARRYTVSISGAKDMEGNQMSGTHTFSFQMKTPKRIMGWYIGEEGETLENIADRPDTYDDKGKWEKIIRDTQDQEAYAFRRDAKRLKVFIK
ncbi:Ig-like domain-containing protein [bacterium]|nr:Ig-like domain-containing protein [bacterium]